MTAKTMLRAAMTAALLFAASPGDASAAGVARPLGASLAEVSAIENVRCCGWGPRGWYDTWRHCHYCGFGHPYGYCRFSVPRWRWFCPR